ncbi:MAG: TIR domain-containing protein, partial [Candidatus Dormibacteraeota bacterium]|nr:TIR domain-containing protein [Candidatus Dormibacteraeota bacterium]
MSYDGFISYSHSADGKLAPAIQTGLQRLARPWHRIRALHVFRDETGLSVNPHLWSSIRSALDQSRYFVLLASPEAARSPWVNRELQHFLEGHPAENILPVLTDGELVWDSARGDYDPARSTSLPAALQGRFAEEPRHLDLRWAREEDQLDLRHSRFRQAVAGIAAPMHGVPREALEGEDVRLHRRAMRLAWASVALLALLTLGATTTGALALNYANAATASAGRARAAEARALNEADNARRAQADARLQASNAQAAEGSARTEAELQRQAERRAEAEGAKARDAEAVASQQATAATASAVAARNSELAARNAAAAERLARNAQVIAAAEARAQADLARQEAAARAAET